MNLVKKISQIFSFLLFAILLTSCEDRCFEADEFDSHFVVVDSYPQNDGIVDVSITNDYAEWHEPSLRSNGDEFVIKITGSWTPWNGRADGGMDDVELNSLDECNLCAVKGDDSSLNCLCFSGQTPKAEIGKECRTVSVLGSYSDENNPNLCTCTTDPAQGNPYGENVKYRLLNYYEKDGTLKIADRQSRCRFVGGAGLYIGLFGPSGLVVPKRIYHLYSFEKGCSINKNSNGECINGNGEDKSYTVFRSKNNRIFMRDDGLANDGNDLDTSDDIYHTSNEIIKFKFYDEEYENNYGKYRLEIQKGVGDGSERNKIGLLEFMVRLVEDIVLGDINGDNERVGGMVEFMYKSIVQDSFFINFIQISLILYVSIYGLAVLSGVAEITKKELMSRILKIALILLFTSAESWVIYNDIVVGFFYDGMNFMISFFMTLSDQAVDSARILDASVGREVVDNGVMISNAHRFTYIDNTIMMLMSEAVAAKIVSLVFSTPFGIFYVLIIYALVIIFIIVMSYAAMLYIINVMKIVFGLSLGPIFILFALFGETKQMFKNWISFLAGRSLEIIMLFFVLYNFVIILNQSFVELLSYKACLEYINLVIFKLPYLKAYVADRSLNDWFMMFFQILGLTYMTYVVMEKIGDVAGSLISVDGVGNGGSGASSFGLAGKMMSGLAGLASGVAGKAALAGAYGTLGVAKVGAVTMRESKVSPRIRAAMGNFAEKTGLAFLGRAVSDRVPFGASFKNPREFMRDQKYKAMIKQAQSAADKKGLKGAEKDAFVRKEALNIFQNSVNKGGNIKVTRSEPHTANFMGMNLDNFSKTMHHQLTEKPLREAIKKEAKRVKNSRDPNDIKFGKDMKEHLNKFSKEWAKNNLSAGHVDVEKMMKEKDTPKMSKFERTLHKEIDKGSELKASKAAKLLSISPEQQAKYMQHLQDKENKQKENSLKLKEDRAQRFDLKVNGVNLLAPARMTANLAGDIARGVKSVAIESVRPNLARKNFERNLQNEQDRSDSWGKYFASKANLANRNNITDYIASKMFGKGRRQKNLQETEERRKDIIRNNLQKNTLNEKSSKIYQINNLGEKIEDKFKNIEHLAEEKDKRDEDRRIRQTMQNTLREDATKDLKDAFNKDNRFFKKGTKELIEGSLPSMLGGKTINIFGEHSKEAIKNKDIDAKSPFEQASRLEFARSKLGLKGENVEKYLSDKLNEKINSDLKDISTRIKDASDKGNLEEFKKANQDLEEVNNEKYALFSTSTEGRYGKFLQDELDKKSKEIEEKIEGFDRQDIASQENTRNQTDIIAREDEENESGTILSDQITSLSSSSKEKIEEDKEGQKLAKEQNGGAEEDVDRAIYSNNLEALNNIEKLQEESLKLESKAKERAELNRVQEEREKAEIERREMERLEKEKEITELKNSLKTIDVVNERFERLLQELAQGVDADRKAEIERQLENLKAIQEKFSELEGLSSYKKSANNKIRNLFDEEITDKDDFYSITGISKNATDSEFEKVRKIALLKHHPDKNRGQDESATNIIMKIKDLYQKALIEREKDAIAKSKEVKLKPKIQENTNETSNNIERDLNEALEKEKENVAEELRATLKILADNIEKDNNGLDQKTADEIKKYINNINPSRFEKLFGEIPSEELLEAVKKEQEEENEKRKKKGGKNNLEDKDDTLLKNRKMQLNSRIKTMRSEINSRKTSMLIGFFDEDKKSSIQSEIDNLEKDLLNFEAEIENIEYLLED